MLLPTLRLDETANEPGMSAPGGSAAPPATMLDHLLVEAAIQCPEADALVGNFGRITYADLLIRAQNIAVVLKRHGVGQGDFVAVAMTTSPVVVTAIAGIVLAGAAYVPVTPGPLPSAFMTKLRAVGTRILLCAAEDLQPERELRHCWKTLGPVLDASRMEQETMPSSSETQLNVVSPDAPAALFLELDAPHQSNGVAATHRSIARLVSAGRMISASDRLMNFDAGETFLLPPGDQRHSGIFHLWGSLLHGACLALPPDGLSPSAFTEWILWHGVSVLSLPVARVAECMDHAPGTFSKLRFLFVETDGKSGDIPSQRIEWLLQHHPGLQIVHTYASENIPGFATAYRVPANYQAQAALPIGLPLQGLRAGILDGMGRPVRVGEIGDLAFTGVASTDSDGEAAPSFTGQRARLRADGLLELHGPATRQPLTVSVPASSEAVANATADISTDDATTDESATSAGKQEVNAMAKVAHLRKLSMPPGSTASEHRVIDVVSKENKAENEQLLSPERYHEKVLEQVRSLWLRLLRRNSIGYEEDFFEAGGTRVQMIRMHAELNRRFPGAITMSQLSVLTTIRKIYEHLVADPTRTAETSLARRGA